MYKFIGVDEVDDGGISPKNMLMPLYVSQMLSIETALEAQLAYNKPSVVLVPSTVFKYANDGTISNSTGTSKFRTSKNAPDIPEVTAPLYKWMDEQACIASSMFTKILKYPLANAGDQVLVYGAGDQFTKHADNGILQPDGKWVKNTAQRCYTSILYTGECSEPTKPGGFSGGQLRFPHLVDTQGIPVTVTPRVGTYVFFPSHPKYMHEVLPVTAGFRLCISRWYSI